MQEKPQRWPNSGTTRVTTQGPRSQLPPSSRREDACCHLSWEGEQQEAPSWDGALPAGLDTPRQLSLWITEFCRVGTSDGSLCIG